MLFEKSVSNVVIGYIILTSLIGFVVMGVDKQRSIRRKWRIPEKTLFIIASIGGGIGSFFGMYFFHHKTKHAKFVIILPITAVFYALIILKLLRVI